MDDVGLVVVWYLILVVLNKVLFDWNPVKEFLLATKSRTSVANSKVVQHKTTACIQLHGLSYLKESDISNGVIWCSHYEVYHVPCLNEVDVNLCLIPMFAPFSSHHP